MTEVTWATTPNGQYGVGPVWADLPTVDPADNLVLIHDLVHAGIIFDAASAQGLRFDAENRVLAGPIITGFTIRGTFFRSILSSDDNRVRIYMVPEAAPANYSPTLDVLTRGEVFIQDFTLAIPAPPFTNVQLDLVFSAESVTRMRGLCMGMGRWSGRIALTLETLGPSFGMHNDAVRPLQAITTQEPFHTGMHIGSRYRRARVVHDFKEGFPYLSDEATRDGYLEGTPVHFSTWDPEDPGDTFVPPAGEGVVSGIHSEIPNLEK